MPDINDIKTAAEGVASKAGEVIDDVKEKAAPVVDAVKEKAGQAGEAIKNKAEEITGHDLDGDGKVGA